MKHLHVGFQGVPVAVFPCRVLVVVEYCNAELTHLDLRFLRAALLKNGTTRLGNLCCPPEPGTTTSSRRLPVPWCRLRSAASPPMCPMSTRSAGRTGRTGCGRGAR